MNYLTVEKLGDRQELTPERFLLCRGTRVSRTGEMVYGPGETPIAVGTDGLAHIVRHYEDVFEQESLDSFNGKPVVHEHPPKDVDPKTWKNLAVGVVMNARRGEGAEDSFVVADLLIQNQDEIELVRSGRVRELSVGYDAEYEQTGPGWGRQYKIRVNHVALVDSGRCGPRCAIGDRKYKELTMTWLDKLKAAFAGKDEAAFNAALAEAPKEGSVILTQAQIDTIAAKVRDAKKNKDDDDDDDEHATTDAIAAVAKDVKDIKTSVDAMDKRVKDLEEKKKKDEEEEEEEERKAKDNTEIEGSLEEEAPAGSGDKAKKARDSAYLVDSFQESVALAEALVPGIAIPAYSKGDGPRKTLDSLCQFRRTALDLARNRPELRGFIDNLLGGRELKARDCAGVRAIFRSAGEYAKSVNNRTRDDRRQDTAPKGVRSIADINKRNEEFYKNQTA